MKGTQTAALVLLIIVGLLFWLYTQKKLKPILQIVTGSAAAGGTPAPAVSTVPGGVPSLFVPGANSLMGTAGGLPDVSGIVSGDQYGLNTGNIPLPQTKQQAKSFLTDAAIGLASTLGPIGAIGASIAKAFGFRF